MWELRFDADTPQDLSASERSTINEYFRRFGLAPLPEHADFLLYGEWAGLLTGEMYLTFHAPEGEVAQFLGASEALELAQSFDEEHPLVAPCVPDSEGIEATMYCKSTSCVCVESFPWWVPTAEEEGRMFFIPFDLERGPDSHMGGQLIVDDELNVLWIKLVRS